MFFPQSIGLALARLTHWKVKIEQPPPEKCVIIGAYHTSGWDLIPTLILNAVADLNFNWIGKDTLFHRPFGVFMRGLGGIPVNRHSHNNFVEQMVEKFRDASRLRIAISPEGTRQITSYWKTGFYYIAQGAGVPIVMGYADYATKTVGLGPNLWPTGNIHLDFDAIRKFYQGITPKFPGKQGEITLREDYK
ncbi:MAG TPA: 1-acyl-sn-glycerol-3-phosphate acyltransferase [Anaerolineales bacterium]|nr:1-acyl-sn-glycerol-3-phosphate acyltransferase [Anaerolineales bacterium]